MNESHGIFDSLAEITASQRELKRLLRIASAAENHHANDDAYPAQVRALLLWLANQIEEEAEKIRKAAGSLDYHVAAATKRYIAELEKKSAAGEKAPAASLFFAGGNLDSFSRTNSR